MIWAPCGSLQLWGGSRWVGRHLGAWGGVPRHVHMHVHARTCTKCEDKHVRKLQMATTMEAAMFIMFNMRAWEVPPPNPTPTHPPIHPPEGVPPQISKNAIRLERIKIFRFRLKIWNLWRIPHPWVGVFFGGWMGGWVG